MKKNTLAAARLCAVVGFLAVGVASAAQEAAPLCTDNTRACMIATARTYFDAIAAHDGSKVPFAATARRTEQGRDTGNGEDTMRSVLDKEPDMSLGETRWFVDEAQHTVIGFTLLHLTGQNADPDRPTHPTSGKPTTVHLAERFKVVDGLIHEVEAIFYIDLGEATGSSGWAD